MSEPSLQRDPLINVGTHARTWAVDTLVSSFLDHAGHDNDDDEGGGVQVISLGAGTDTRYWRLKRQCQREEASRTTAAGSKKKRTWRCRRWLEVDYPESTAGKAMSVTRSRLLRDQLVASGRDGDGDQEVKVDMGGTRLVAHDYALVPGDLNVLFPESSSDDDDCDGSSWWRTLSDQGLVDLSVPTLLLAECLFVYLSPARVRHILRSFANTFRHGHTSVVAYDPFHLDDSFGKVMVRNLSVRAPHPAKRFLYRSSLVWWWQSRGLTFADPLGTPTLGSLLARLTTAGFAAAGAQAWTMREIKDRVVPCEERLRVARVARLDEVEELDLLLEHYALVTASLDPSLVLSFAAS